MATEETGKIKTQKERERFGLLCILKIASAMNVVLPATSQTTYLENLLSLEPEALEKAVQRTIREWDRPSMMPPISYILARSGTSPLLRAEQSWEAVRRFVYKNWHPDIGYTSEQRLDPVSEYAVRQIGGLRKLHDVPDEHLQFLRRDFLEAHQRYNAEDGAQTALSHQLASDTLKELEEMGKKQLAEKTGD